MHSVGCVTRRVMQAMVAVSYVRDSTMFDVLELSNRATLGSALNVRSVIFRLTNLDSFVTCCTN